MICSTSRASRLSFVTLQTLLLALRTASPRLCVKAFRTSWQFVVSGKEIGQKINLRVPCFTFIRFSCRQWRCRRDCGACRAFSYCCLELDLLIGFLPCMTCSHALSLLLTLFRCPLPRHVISAQPAARCWVASADESLRRLWEIEMLVRQ